MWFSTIFAEIGLRGRRVFSVERAEVDLERAENLSAEEVRGETGAPSQRKSWPWDATQEQSVRTACREEGVMLGILTVISPECSSM